MRARSRSAYLIITFLAGFLPWGFIMLSIGGFFHALSVKLNILSVAGKAKEIISSNDE